MGLLKHKLRTSRLVLLFGILVVIVIVVSAALSLVTLRQREIEDWRRQMGSISLILAEQTSQTLFSAYVVLDSVTEHIQQSNIADETTFRTELSSRETFEMLRGKIAHLPQVDVASIVAANGDNINFSRSYPIPPINLADRDYFKALLGDGARGDFISAPVRNKGNGKWTFYISRRLNDANGQFMGLVIIGMSVDVFTSFYERVATGLGEGASIDLYRSDLILLTRWPRNDALIGRLNASGSTHDVITRQTKQDDVVLVSTPRFATGQSQLRLSAVRTLDRYPLVLTIIVTDDLILSSWRRYAGLIGGVAAASVLTLLFGLYYLVRNLSERELDLVNMARLTRQAEAANRAKSSFLATMSHEIRTPMNGILGMAQLLLMPELSLKERHGYARSLLASGQTLLALLNDILDLSKVEAGKLDLTPAPTDPQQIIAQTSALFEPTAETKRIHVEKHWSGPAHQRYLSDPIRLQQMLSNLVSNAIKFTPGGTVRIEGREVERANGEALLEFAVCDNGIGIDPEKIPMLFKAFSQADSSTTRKYGGSGLGLSIVRSLATLMNGEAGVTSQIGQGSRFWFRIRAPIIEELSAPGQPDRAALGTIATGPAPAREGTVLVVDDNPINREVVSAMLGKIGIECRCVSNGQEAVSAVAGGIACDLIFMDVQMPVMDGCTATEHIRKLQKDLGTRRVPIVALTAGAFETDRARCLESGMDDFLAKPIHMKALRAMLEKWILVSDIVR
jgi:signal transduction histidine kinase/ActR/RegA family two-component response regulator